VVVGFWGEFAVKFELGYYHRYYLGVKGFKITSSSATIMRLQQFAIQILFGFSQLVVSTLNFASILPPFFLGFSIGTLESCGTVPLAVLFIAFSCCA